MNKKIFEEIKEIDLLIFRTYLKYLYNNHFNSENSKKAIEEISGYRMREDFLYKELEMSFDLAGDYARTLVPGYFYEEGVIRDNLLLSASQIMLPRPNELQNIRIIEKLWQEVIYTTDDYDDLIFVTDIFQKNIERAFNYYLCEIIDKIDKDSSIDNKQLWIYLSNCKFNLSYLCGHIEKNFLENDFDCTKDLYSTLLMANVKMTKEDLIYNSRRKGITFINRGINLMWHSDYEDNDRDCQIEQALGEANLKTGATLFVDRNDLYNILNDVKKEIEEKASNTSTSYNKARDNIINNINDMPKTLSKVKIVSFRK